MFYFGIFSYCGLIRLLCLYAYSPCREFWSCSRVWVDQHIDFFWWRFRGSDIWRNYGFDSPAIVLWDAVRLVCRIWGSQGWHRSCLRVTQSVATLATRAFRVLARSWSSTLKRTTLQRSSWPRFKMSWLSWLKQGNPKKKNNNNFSIFFNIFCPFLFHHFSFVRDFSLPRPGSGRRGKSKHESSESGGGGPVGTRWAVTGPVKRVFDADYFGRCSSLLQCCSYVHFICETRIRGRRHRDVLDGFWPEFPQLSCLGTGQVRPVKTCACSSWSGNCGSQNELTERGEFSLHSSVRIC